MQVYEKVQKGLKDFTYFVERHISATILQFKQLNVLKFTFVINLKMKSKEYFIMDKQFLH